MHKHTRTTIALLVWLGISATGLAFGIIWLRDTPMSLTGQVFAGFITALAGLATLILSVITTHHLVTADGKDNS